MVISLCGNENNKKIVINRLKEVYQDKVIICNYYAQGFEERVNNETIFYESMENYNSSDFSKQDLMKQYFQLINENKVKFNNYIEERVNKKIKRLLEKNKDKIIVLISTIYLEKDINKTVFFEQSDLKILVGPNEDTFFNIKYNENEFDYVFCDLKEFDVCKVIKL